MTGRWQRTDLHALDQAALQGEAMAHSLIGEPATGQNAHDLMDLGQDAAATFQVKGHWLHVRIDLAPLLGPVSAHSLWAMDKAALERARPSDVGSHEDESGVDVARIEGCIGCTE